ncbi:MAG: tyrosine-protein phosphatase [Blastocatellia bacterium]|nr:tyrosine-protein phosphatase [Blastocatellia bacterium]
MKNLNRRRMLIAGVLLFAVAGSTFAQSKVRYAELPNFHLVNSQLYRGAQPKIGGLQTLKTMGIKAIVNLRGKDEQTGAEGQEARALGLRYYSIPLPGFSEPKDKEVQQVLDIINNRENQPVFVHCHHGEDRTGTIIACYRITHDGWTAAGAKKEAEKLGMSWTQFGMKRYIDKFYRQRPIPRRAEANRRGRPYGK